MSILTTGVEVSEFAIYPIMLTLESLCKDKPIAFYELVVACRATTPHHFFGNTTTILADYGLLDNAINNPQPQTTIRDIVRAAVVGDELAMRIVNPVATP